MIKIALSALLVTGSSAAAEACAPLLADPGLPVEGNAEQYAKLVECRAQALATTLEDSGAVRCIIASKIVGWLDLTSIRSSLGPRLQGTTTLAQLGDVSIEKNCTRINFGEPGWIRSLDLVAASKSAAVVRLTDRAEDGSYDRPSAFKVSPDFSGYLTVETFCEIANKANAIDNRGC